MLRTLNKGRADRERACARVAFWNRNDLPGAIDFHPQLERRAAAAADRQAAHDRAVCRRRVSRRAALRLRALRPRRVVPAARRRELHASLVERSLEHGRRLRRLERYGVQSRRSRELDFWNGIFTCNVQTRDSVAWSRFKMNQLSNNHSDLGDPFIRDRVGGDPRRRSDPHQGLARALRRGRRRAARHEHDARRLRRRRLRDDPRRRVRDRRAGRRAGWRAAMYAALALLIAYARRALRAAVSPLSRLT